MAALTDTLLRAFRLRCGSAFRARGVVLAHPGILLDQPRAATVVEHVYNVLCRRYAREAVEEALGRVEVLILPPQPGLRVEARAEWLGGFLDRGRVTLRVTTDWPDRLAQTLLALLLAELDPGRHPADLVDG